MADVFFVLARFPRSIARGVAGFWRALPVVTRSRLVAALGVIVAGVTIATVVVPNLPCAAPGGDDCPPDHDAIELVPADSLAYVHTNLDQETEQTQRAIEVAERMPGVSQQLLAQALPQLSGGSAPAEPWFGGEIGIAVIAEGDSNERVELLEATDAAAAAEYAESLAAGEARTDAYRDVDIREDQRGVARAVVDGFLVLGTGTGVRAVIDAATDAEGQGALADDPVATEALDELPDHRVAEAYLSAAGIEAFVADPDATFASLEPFVDSGASQGAAISLSAQEDGFALASRSVLDAERSESDPGFFAAFDEFSPKLATELSSDSLFYLGLANPQDTLDALLQQATVGAPGIASAVTDLVERLREAADVDLQRDLLDSFGGEAAFTVVPREPIEPEEGDDQGAPVPTTTSTPFLEFLADDVDEAAAREALARLQEPIAREFDLDLGAPGFDQRRIGDIDAQVLRLSPVAQLVYAIVDSQLVIANDAAAVERLDEGADGGLASSERYLDTVEELPDEPALIAYLDLQELLSFAERSGLAEDTAYGAFAADLRQLESLGLTVTRREQTLEVDGRILVD